MCGLLRFQTYYILTVFCRSILCTHSNYAVFKYIYVLIQGQVIRKLVNATLGLKVNGGIHFSSIIMFNFTAYVLYSFRLFKLKTEE